MGWCEWTRYSFVLGKTINDRAHQNDSQFSVVESILIAIFSLVTLDLCDSVFAAVLLNPLIEAIFQLLLSQFPSTRF